MKPLKTLAYLTPDLPGVGGRIKQRPEDFRVTELPLYPPSGEGTHTYFGLLKRGIPTQGAIGRVAKALGLRPGAFSAAGLKDAHAVTEQTISVEHLSDSQVETLQNLRTDEIAVTWVSRHTNKLKMGHLAGNRFQIRIRDVDAEAIEAARAIMEVLARRGVPNYFGAQRFGMRGDNAALGAAVLGGDYAEFIRLLLGGPEPTDSPNCRRARELFEQDQLQEALAAWPGRFRNERAALNALIRRNGDARAAFRAVDKFLKRFCVNALQSHLFNQVLSARIDAIDTVSAGDWAKKTESGGVFQVEDEAADRPRAAAFEISPTGPLFGYRVRLADGPGAAIERETLARLGLTGDDWRKSGAFKAKGTRRALRYRAADPAITAGDDEHGPYLDVAFAAPAGSYATVLLRELMKNEAADSPTSNA